MSSFFYTKEATPKKCLMKDCNIKIIKYATFCHKHTYEMINKGAHF